MPTDRDPSTTGNRRLAATRRSNPGHTGRRRRSAGAQPVGSVTVLSIVDRIVAGVVDGSMDWPKTMRLLVIVGVVWAPVTTSAEHVLRLVLR
ncbi:hypothetical protein ACSVDM_17795 [Nocardia sp. JW2]|uniref:hypothetical protein n=1 Tax=Nocardia sp. JW2 TaxID=3450738 RepID=UPI003F434C6C